MPEGKRPSIAELEKIMEDAGDREVRLHPDGTVSVEGVGIEGDQEQESDVLTTLRAKLEEAKELKHSAEVNFKLRDEQCDHLLRKFTAFRQQLADLQAENGRLKKHLEIGEDALRLACDFGQGGQLVQANAALLRENERLRGKLDLHYKDYDDCGDLLQESVNREAKLQAELDALRVAGEPFALLDCEEEDDYGNLIATPQREDILRLRTTLAQREPKPEEEKG